jgi:internalin A
VSDLAPLKHVPNLQTLYCGSTQVSDLAPLKHVPNLQTLDCSSTQMSDLALLKHVPNLQTLSCSFTQVSDLAPLKHVPNLQTLSCAFTQVSDLAPLKHVPNLQTLDCSSTQVSDLSSLEYLQNLQTISCSDCRLISVYEKLWRKPSLVTAYLFQSHLSGIPTEVLSQSPHANCLDTLRAHLSDLEAGREAMSDAKLLVLGNGRIGKTQMCMKLRGEAYDPRVGSTHGVLVTSAPLPRPRGDVSGRLQIWDFGGQDIYLGTHALFARSRAIFALLWIPEAEAAAEHRHEGLEFRNRPLAYWLDYARHFGSADCPVLLIQARCDAPADEWIHPPVSDEAFGAFPYRKVLHYSALNDRGRAALDETLAEAQSWLNERQGIATIGAGRARVKREIEAMRDADAARPPLERRHRTLTQEEFVELCRKAGGIAEPKHLLSFLHNVGTVFYREGLFDDRIIVDQAWALDAIYAVFDRKRAFRKLQRQNGRFTRSDLGEWIWDEAGHGRKEQELLLSMMQSCGICFVHKPASTDGKFEAEYIAPELLPEEPGSEIAQKWDSSLPIEKAEFTYSLLPPSLMPAIIKRIGEGAGIAADYWRNGLYVYESGTGGRALISQELTVGWQGRIKVETQRGQAARLLERLCAMIEEEQRRMGIAPVDPAPRIAEAKPLRDKDQSDELKALTFDQEPRSEPEYFVSYAWADGTPEGHKREEIVDQICLAAERRGIVVLRDKKTMGLGDRISKFMDRIGRGNRVFVVLSEKYLKSPYCMFELLEVWRNARQEDTEFLKRVRIFSLPDAKIRTAVDRAHCAIHWKTESGKLEALVNEHGPDILGEKDHKTYRLMRLFSHHIGDMLAALCDIVQPRTFEELEKYGFEDVSASSDESGST